jgi:hypothetical protein
MGCTCSSDEGSKKLNNVHEENCWNIKLKIILRILVMRIAIGFNWLGRMYNGRVLVL